MYIKRRGRVRKNERKETIPSEIFSLYVVVDRIRGNNLIKFSSSI